MTNLSTAPALAGKFHAFESLSHAVTQPMFSAVEQTVLDIAWREARRLHVFDRTPFRKLRHFLGLREPLRLADTKLEALRQYTIRLNRASSAADAPAEQELRAAGYSTEQVATLHLAFCGLRSALVR